MALDESTDGLKKFESNGITAYMDPRLAEFLAPHGDIKVDFVNNPMGQSGYSIKIGEGCKPGACGSAGESGCGTDENKGGCCGS